MHRVAESQEPRARKHVAKEPDENSACDRCTDRRRHPAAAASLEAFRQVRWVAQREPDLIVA